MSGMRLDLVSATEIAVMLGLSRQRVQQLASSGELPEPLGVLEVSHTKIWLRADIEAWMEARRNKGGGRPS